MVPIGFGILIGNIPFKAGFQIGVYETGSVFNYLYFGVLQGVYPPLIFLGIGAMTDFSALISNPKLLLIGAAAQLGIFGAYAIALILGFSPTEAGAIGIIGGADGPGNHLSLVETCARAFRCYCHFRILLYGTCAGDSAACYEAADH